MHGVMGVNALKNTNVRIESGSFMEKLGYIKDLIREHIVSHNTASCYIYIKDLIQDNMSVLMNSLPKGFELFYAMKANPERKIVSLLKDFGCGVDVASGGELKIALEEGVSRESISFAGPGKTDEDIVYGVRNNIYSFSIENIDEIKKIETAAAQNKTIQNVSVRINPDKKFAGYGMKMGGFPSQFGLEPKQSNLAIETIIKYKSLDLIGFHMHVGSQVLDAKIIGDVAGYLIEYALYVKDKYGLDIRYLNFGGGLGIPYHEGQELLDLDMLGKYLHDIINQTSVRKHLANTRFVMEPGRFLIGNAGVYVSKILYIKSSFEKQFIIIDGGMHHNFAASGNLGQVIKRNYFIDILRFGGNGHASPPKSYDIVGSLCTPLDKMASNVMLADVRVGDYVCIFNSGAYGYSASPLYFLSHPFPEIIII